MNAEAVRFTDPLERLLDLVLSTRFEDLPAEAVDAATVFFLDTVGVACAGRMAPGLAELTEASTAWGEAPAQGASIWNMQRRVPAAVAALCNGYQCHALEYDCVYEPGVILPAAPVFAALMAKTEQLLAQGRAPSGRDLVRAFTVALEVSCTLAAASHSAMFFFRPATTGVFSALAALACLDPLPREWLRYAFGIAYSQACGPMQAHEEGSMMLAMQMGFAARNAVQAYDMARVGITAPVEILAGRFGFFNNFEHGGTIGEALAQMGQPWKVTQLSHKPFPSGRVTHGVIHTMRQLGRELGLDAGNALARIREIHVELPPLGMRLVGRPMVHRPAPNYARLSVPYVAAAEVLYGGVDPTSFSPERLNGADVETLGRRVTTVEKPHPNPNAFYPQSLTLELVEGTRVHRDIPHAWGHPLLPLTRAEREDKFRLCWRLTRDTSPAGEARMEEAIAWLDRLRDEQDVRPLVELLR
jgi:2-methylcitrate dehydratase PrpD